MRNALWNVDFCLDNNCSYKHNFNLFYEMNDSVYLIIGKIANKNAVIVEESSWNRELISLYSELISLSYIFEKFLLNISMWFSYWCCYPMTDNFWYFLIKLIFKKKTLPNVLHDSLFGINSSIADLLLTIFFSVSMSSGISNQSAKKIVFVFNFWI